jgi:hypothetical protein
MRNILLSGSGSFLNYIQSPYREYIEARRRHARVARVRRQLERLPRYYDLNSNRFR